MLRAQPGKEDRGVCPTMALGYLSGRGPGVPTPAQGSPGGLGVGWSWSMNGVCEIEPASPHHPHNQVLLLPSPQPLALLSLPSSPLGAFPKGIPTLISPPLFHCLALKTRAGKIVFPSIGNSEPARSPEGEAQEAGPWSTQQFLEMSCPFSHLSVLLI